VTSTPPLGLGFVGAGRFAAFVASAATDLLAVTVARYAAPVNTAVRVPTAGTRAPTTGVSTRSP
jgi:hypothetical protein